MVASTAHRRYTGNEVSAGQFLRNSEKFFIKRDFLGLAAGLKKSWAAKRRPQSDKYHFPPPTFASPPSSLPLSLHPSSLSSKRFAPLSSKNLFCFFVVFQTKKIDFACAAVLERLLRPVNFSRRGFVGPPPLIEIP